MFGPPVALINPPGLPVERGKIHEFCNSIGDANAMSHDEIAAKEAGLPSVVAPPTYCSTQAFFSGPDDAKVMMELGLDLRFVLHGGQEFEFVRPLFAGDQLTPHQGEVESYTKEGKRGGLMKFVEIHSHFTDQNGDIVVRIKNTIIQTGGVVKE